MVGGFCGKSKDYIGNDEYYTPKEVWELIKPFLPTDKVIWEAFRGDGKSAEHLKSFGLTVVCEDEDFFTANHGDLIVSNPPFSIKKAVVERLYQLNKPFVLIMPYEVLFYKYFAPFQKDIQLIIPKTRINFLKEGNLVKFNYDCVFFCWKLGLPKDLIFV